MRKPRYADDETLSPSYRLTRFTSNSVSMSRTCFCFGNSMQQGEVTAQIGLAGHGDFRLRGKIVFVDNLVNNLQRRRSGATMCQIPKANILPGMQASIRLMIGEPREELILPRPGAAIHERENHPFAARGRIK